MAKKIKVSDECHVDVCHYVPTMEHYWLIGSLLKHMCKKLPKYSHKNYFNAKVAKELVQLENYFYATLPGDVEVLNSEFKADMAFNYKESE